jgi:hypothetical protein
MEPDDQLGHDSLHEEPTPTPSDTKQLTGLLLGGLGGLLTCVGALMPWVRTTFEDAPDEVSPTWIGIDLTDGKVVFGLGIVVLAGLIVSRLAKSMSLARTAALVVIVAAFAAVGVAAVTLVTADSRFRDSTVEDILSTIGSTTDEVRSQIEELIDLELAAGPFAVIGGGILAVVGGALTLAWARSCMRGDATADGGSGMHRD